jgi:outer membrane receptor protein involved in Fe transport
LEVQSIQKTGLVITPFEKTKFGSLSFKILYGSAFRAPTFQELYDKNQAFQQGGVFGNGTQRFQTFGQAGYGNLKPETIRTGEVGMEYQTPYKPLVFQVNYFYTRIYNNIEGVNTSGAFPGKTDIYRNLRGRTIIGSEAEFKLNYTSRNYIFLNMSWFQAIDNGGMTPGLNADNKTFLTNIPQGRANLGINWELTKYFVLNNTIWASSERYSNARFPFERISTRGFRFPQYHIWNVSLATTEEVLTNMEFRLSIFNLQNYKLYDESNTAIESYSNRAIPAAYIFQRYIEFKMTYFLL